jgi:hypothetical protein
MDVYSQKMNRSRLDAYQYIFDKLRVFMRSREDRVLLLFGMEAHKMIKYSKKRSTEPRLRIRFLPFSGPYSYPYAYLFLLLFHVQGFY